MITRMFCALLWALAVPATAWAQAYPTRNITLVVPFAAGGPTDVVARILADLLTARWGGKSVVIENRPGAGTIVATAAVAKAMQRKTGARGLRSIMEGILLDTMFDLPSLEGVEEVVISREVVENTARPLYIYADRAGDAGATAS